MKRFLSICCTLAALVLMALPFSIQMDYLTNPGPPEEFTNAHFSYISIIPIENANWMPIITAILTLVVLFMLVIGIKKDRGMIKDYKIPICICLILCIAATFVSWSVFSTLTIIGAVVFALHFALLSIQLLRFERVQSDSNVAN